MPSLSTARRIGAAGLAAGALAVAATTPAGAATTDQLVNGTTLGVIGLGVATPATFGTNLAPGTTPTSTLGTLTSISTSGSWTLSVKDNAVGAGHMQAAALGCTNSPAQLANSLQVSVSPVIPNGSITSGTTRTISGVNQTVASATAVPLAATIFNTNYAQPIGASEALQEGCVYSLTATYTLQ